MSDFTPYTFKDNMSKPVMAQLIKQWLELDDTWEEFPISKRDMYKKYEAIRGILPAVTLPTMVVFTNLIEMGVLA